MKTAPPRLEPILSDVSRRLAERRGNLPLAELRRLVEPDGQRALRFVAALRTGGPAIIAEFKRRSPSSGGPPAGPPVDEGRSSEVSDAPEAPEAPEAIGRARAYARGGAAAISVLTERDHFGGSPEDLSRIAPAGLPLLRKDFLLDESMVLESALWGADAVLLLPCVLTPSVLAELAHCAHTLGLASLIEVHDEGELAAALALPREHRRILGVNARNLSDFSIDLGRVTDLLPAIPADTVRVAESGVSDAGDLRRVRAAGADAVLIGGALMRSRDPEALLRGWREALRA
jgi:indole-3-glycerol phosphate synthase